MDYEKNIINVCLFILVVTVLTAIVFKFEKTSFYIIKIHDDKLSRNAQNLIDEIKFIEEIKNLELLLTKNNHDFKLSKERVLSYLKKSNYIATSSVYTSRFKNEREDLFACISDYSEDNKQYNKCAQKYMSKIVIKD